MSSSLPHAKRLKSRRFENVFDNLKSFSQPVVVTNVFGKSDKRSATVIQRICEDDSSTKEPSSSRKSVNHIDPGSYTSQLFSNDNKRIQDATIFVIVLPMILKIDFTPFKQPLMLKIYADNLREFGFTIPFDEFFNATENYFTIELNSNKLTVQILATGDSISSLKECLSKNISINTDWKGLKKIIRLTEKTSTLIHSPLENQEDTPPQQVLSMKSFIKIFSNVVGNGANPQRNIEIDPTGPKVSNCPEIQEEDQDSALISETQENEKMKKKNQLQSEKSSSACIESDISDSLDLSSMEINSRKYNSLIDELERKRLLLSEYDTTGSTFIVIIEALKTLNTILTEKDQKELDFINSVPEVDQTYKVSQKNQIFIEGLIQFDLNKYQAALRKSRALNPGAIAYQLINICFPETYMRDVTLGKRNLSRDEIDDLLKKRSRDSKIKYPLIYIWGFKDPFSMRMLGKFDYNLGQKRVTAFIQHIFRKARIMRYTDSLESRVRERIVKTLCAKNAEIPGNELQNEEIQLTNAQTSDDIETDEFSYDIDSLFDQES